MGKASIGFLQELQLNGQVANSFIRKLEALFFVVLVAYMTVAILVYQNHFNQYVVLLRESFLSEQSFNTLVSQLRMYDWDTLLILIVATVAPKVVQKFAEAKIGVTGSSENTTTTTTSDKTVTVPVVPPVAPPIV